VRRQGPRPGPGTAAGSRTHPPNSAMGAVNPATMPDPSGKTMVRTDLGQDHCARVTMGLQSGLSALPGSDTSDDHGVVKKRHLLVVAGLGLLTMAAASCSNSSTPPMSTSAAGPTSTTSASTGTHLPGSATSTAVWPTSSSATRYGSPEAAATGFATGFIHMTSPLIGSLRSGDARSGEIAVRPGSAGPVTTVLVRRLGSDDS
jgi:hypothetical protein